MTPRISLVAENLPLRQQLIVLQRSVKRPKLWNRDRLFWIVLCRLWNGGHSSLPGTESLMDIDAARALESRRGLERRL